MMEKTSIKFLPVLVTLFCLAGCILFTGSVIGADAPPTPDMPAHWKIVYDFQVSPEQVQAMSAQLGADLRGVRNTLYDVNGMRVQINTIISSDVPNAERLMARLRSIKSDDTLVHKGLTVYEFVGKNDVLPLIAEGRRHLVAQ